MAVKKKEKQIAGISCEQIAAVSYFPQQHLFQDLKALTAWEGA